MSMVALAVRLLGIAFVLVGTREALPLRDGLVLLLGILLIAHGAAMGAVAQARRTPAASVEKTDA